jgi:RNA polymerase sigma factor (sigma-70 family)
VNSNDEFIPTRQSLLSRLKNWNDQEGWKTFFDTYWKLIYNTAIRARLNDAEAQDVVQETVISVLKSMPTFEYDARNGSFKQWLLRLTGWRIVDQFRKRETANHYADAQRTSTGTAIINRVADPASLNLEKTWDSDWEQNLFDAAIERVKLQVDPKHYQLFDLCVFKRWPVTKVARTMKVSAGAVYMAKHRINKLVKKEVSRLQQKPI